MRSFVREQDILIDRPTTGIHECVSPVPRNYVRGMELMEYLSMHLRTCLSVVPDKVDLKLAIKCFIL